MEQSNEPKSEYEFYKAQYKAMKQKEQMPIWVKSSAFKHEIGSVYHAKDSRFKGAGVFNQEGAFKWGDGTITFPRDQDDLYILDESGISHTTLQAKCNKYEAALKDIAGKGGKLIPAKHEMISIANEALSAGEGKEIHNNKI